MNEPRQNDEQMQPDDSQPGATQANENRPPPPRAPGRPASVTPIDLVLARIDAWVSKHEAARDKAQAEAAQPEHAEIPDDVPRFEST